MSTKTHHNHRQRGSGGRGQPGGHQPGQRDGGGPPRHGSYLPHGANRQAPQQRGPVDLVGVVLARWRGQADPQVVSDQLVTAPRDEPPQIVGVEPHPDSSRPRSDRQLQPGTALEGNPPTGAALQAEPLEQTRITLIERGVKTVRHRRELLRPVEARMEPYPHLATRRLVCVHPPAGGLGGDLPEASQGFHTGVAQQAGQLAVEHDRELQPSRTAPLDGDVHRQPQLAAGAQSGHHGHDVQQSAHGHPDGDERRRLGEPAPACAVSRRLPRPRVPSARRPPAGAGICLTRFPVEVRVPTTEQVLETLSRVCDPNLEKPITDLGLVSDVAVHGETVSLRVKLAIPPSPLNQQLARDVTAALSALEGVREVRLDFGSLSEDERVNLSRRIKAERGQIQPNEIVFSKPGNRTTVLAVASGKGGVGKSSVTVNLATSLAGDGYDVGVLDADIYGYSVPRMLGVSGQPIGFEGLVMPLRAHGCKVISIGFFLPDPDRPVMWRGPMLHRALQQFLSDVWWGDLDFLICDLPPGTGDVAISLGQMLPNADLLVITTPQQAAQKVAARTAQMADETGMRVAGVIENMASFTCPECATSHDIFGSGGGASLAEQLGTELLGRVPIDPRLREGGDVGVPLVLSHPDAPAARVLRDIAKRVAKRAKSVVGRPLPLTPGSAARSAG